MVLAMEDGNGSSVEGEQAFLLLYAEVCLYRDELREEEQVEPSN